MTAIAVLQFAALIASFVCFVLATANVPAKWNLIASGLALFIAAQLLARWPV